MPLDYIAPDSTEALSVESLASVMRGLEQARKGQFSESPPDLDADWNKLCR